MTIVTRVYEVHVSRRGDAWVAKVSDGERSSARAVAHDLRSLERAIRDAIVVAEDLPEGSQADLQLRWQRTILPDDGGDPTTRGPSH